MTRGSAPQSEGQRTPNRQTGGERAVAGLIAAGVDTAFGIPGTHNLELYRAFASEPELSHISVRHEQGAVYAADGFARVSDRVAAVLVTSGPAILNAIAGIANAYADSVAMIVIAPGPSTGSDGALCGAMHEVKNQFGALEQVIDITYRCTPDQDPAEVVLAAVSAATAGRPQPAYVEIPLDVMASYWPATPVNLAGASVPTPAEWLSEEGTKLAIDRATELLGGVRRPVLVVGGGSRRAAVDVTALAERLGAPVLATFRGKGVVADDHPLAVGCIASTRAAQELVESADALVVLGSELSDAELEGSRYHPTGPVIRVDVDSARCNRNLNADIVIVGRVETVVPILLRGLACGSPNSDGRAEQVRQDAGAELGATLAPWREFHDILAGELNVRPVIVGDSSQVTYLGTAHAWRSACPDELLMPIGFATLGYGIPAALGAKSAVGAQPVIAIIGDGAAMFSIQELASVAEHGSDIIVVVVDNGGYAEIRDRMIDEGIPPIAVNLEGTDFVGLAVAMGLKATSVDSGRQAAAAVVAAIAEGGPHLVWWREAPGSEIIEL